MTHLNEGGNVKKKAKDGLPADKWKELARGLKHFTQGADGDATALHLVSLTF